jgi:hypothetical protein
MKSRILSFASAALFLVAASGPLAQSKNINPPSQVPGALIVIDGMEVRYKFAKPISITEKFAIEESIRHFADRFKVWASEQKPSSQQDYESIASWLRVGQRINDAVSLSGCALKDDPLGYCVVVVPSAETIRSSRNPSFKGKRNLALDPEGGCSCTVWAKFRQCSGICVPVGTMVCCRNTDCPMGCQGWPAVCSTTHHACPLNSSCPTPLCEE